MSRNRVVSPEGAIPQAAEVLNPSTRLSPGEVLIDVEYLNLDSASFFDFYSANEGVSESIRNEVLDVVRRKGKLENPRTGSGGMLVGRVVDGLTEQENLVTGQRVASLISLTATPLEILDGLTSWDGKSEIVPLRGTAVLPSERAVFPLPLDVPPLVSLSVLDVCGAPALVERVLGRIRGNEALSVLIVGGGKSAVLSSAAAREMGAVVHSVVPTSEEKERLEPLDLFDAITVADARMPYDMLDALSHVTPPDLVVVCANVPDCEHSALLVVKEGGSVIYFSMATSFTRVALGSESLVRDVDLIIGSGYIPGHAQRAFELLTAYKNLQEYFTKLVNGASN